MKTFELKRKSWHYWLANFAEERVWLHADICSYIRSVLVGTFWFSVMAFTASVVAGFVLYAFGNLFSWLFLGYQLSDVTTIVFSTIFGLLLVFVFLISGEKIHYKLRDSEPGFARLAYRSWKDKFCAKVEFK